MQFEPLRAQKEFGLQRSDSLFDYASQPTARGARRPEAYNREMLILGVGEHPGIFTPLTSMRSQRLEHPFCRRQELFRESGLFARLSGLRFEHRGTP